MLFPCLGTAFHEFCFKFKLCSSFHYFLNNMDRNFCMCFTEAVVSSLCPKLLVPIRFKVEATFLPGAWGWLRLAIYLHTPLCRGG